MSEIVASPSAALHGEFHAPGDKSIGHRAIILGSIAEGVSRITAFSGGIDNLSTIDALRLMGVEIDVDAATIGIHGVGLSGLKAAGEIDCGNSATTMRLLAGLCATQPDTTLLDGDDSLRLRPMLRVKEPLELMGATVEGRALRDEILPPLEVRGGPLKGINYALPMPSAQVKSAILLAALRAQGATTVLERLPSRDHTERMLLEQGAPVTLGHVIRVDPTGWKGGLRPLELEIPGDMSSAAFMLVAACLVPGSEIVARGVGLNPSRTGVLDALRAMGASLEVEPTGRHGGEPIGDVRIRATPLRACEISGAMTVRAIDEVPILALAATQAEGTTVIRDAEDLRNKESDRLSAISRVLRRLGAEVNETIDGLRIEGPTPLGGGMFGPGDVLLDHRVAMSLAVAGLFARAPIRVVGAETISTSFPSFAQGLAALGASIVAQEGYAAGSLSVR